MYQLVQTSDFDYSRLEQDLICVLFKDKPICCIVAERTIPYLELKILFSERTGFEMQDLKLFYFCHDLLKTEIV